MSTVNSIGFDFCADVVSDPAAGYRVIISYGASADVAGSVKTATLSSGVLSAVGGDGVDGFSHRFIDGLTASGFSAADMRSRVLFRVDDTEVDSVADLVAAYAFCCFFAGRRIDFCVGSTVLAASPIVAFAAGLADAGRPDIKVDVVAVDGDDVDAPIVYLNTSNTSNTSNRTGWADVSAGDVSLVRYARRVTLAVGDDPTAALIAFLVVSAVRVRGSIERLPTLHDGDVTVELDRFRRAAARFRRSSTAPDPAALVARAVPNVRSRRLITAAAVPAPAVMLALGSTSSVDGLWHCPRPARHSNADANASMRVDEHWVRCLRCDAEEIDPVRLAADVHGSSFGEAADWILAAVAPQLITNPTNTADPSNDADITHIDDVVDVCGRR